MNLKNREARVAAAQAGKKTYTTGEPCKHGHYGERYTVNGACTECTNGGIRSLARVSNELKPWQPDALQVPTDLDPAALDGLNDYLHACMVSWCDQMKMLTAERQRAYAALLKAKQNARLLRAMAAV